LLAYLKEARATLAYFLKRDFNVLPLYYNSVDYNIKLIAKNTLLSSMLYSILLKQLELVKAYLDNYLQKGFITYSNAAYAFLVLFI
jgi:hypothetical protein